MTFTIKNNPYFQQGPRGLTAVPVKGSRLDAQSSPLGANPSGFSKRTNQPSLLRRLDGRSTCFGGARQALGEDVRGP